MSSTTTLPIGSKVAHPTHGAGIITRIEEKRIGERSHSYYVIETHSLEVMVPVGKAEAAGLRPIRSLERIRPLLDRLSDAPPDHEVPDDYRARQAAVRELLKGGTLVEAVDAVRMLQALKGRRTLGAVDTRLYEAGVEILAGELALASGQEIQEARDTVLSRLQQMGTDDTEI